MIKMTQIWCCLASLAAESQEIQQLIADAGLAVDSLESGLAIHTWFKNINLVLRCELCQQSQRRL